MFVVGLFVLYVFLTSIRLKRVAQSKIPPVLEVFLGWTYVFAIVGVLIYPFYNSDLALSGILAPALTGGVIAIADLWLFEHREVLARIHQKYVYGKIGVALIVIVTTLVQLAPM